MNSKVSIDDFKVITRGLLAAYPRSNFIPNEFTFNLWYKALCDIPYPVLNRASYRYIQSNVYPPTIADIRAVAMDMTVDAGTEASQEWDRLLRALGMAYAPESEAVWEGLPPITKLVVGGYSAFRAWGNTDTSSLESVQRPMFIKRYEEYKQREQREMSVQEAVRVPLPSIESREVKAIEHDTRAGTGVPAPKDLMDKMRRRLGGTVE